MKIVWLPNFFAKWKVCQVMCCGTFRRLLQCHMPYHWHSHKVFNQWKHFDIFLKTFSITSIFSTYHSILRTTREEFVRMNIKFFPSASYSSFVSIFIVFTAIHHNYFDNQMTMKDKVNCNPPFTARHHHLLNKLNQNLLFFSDFPYDDCQ